MIGFADSRRTNVYNIDRKSKSIDISFPLKPSEPIDITEDQDVPNENLVQSPDSDSRPVSVLGKWEKLRKMEKLIKVVAVPARDFQKFSVDRSCCGHQRALGQAKLKLRPNRP